MIDEFYNKINDIKSLTREYLLPTILKKIDECQIFVGKYYRTLNNHLENLNETLSQENIQDFVHNFYELKEKLIILLNDYGNKHELKSFDADHKDYSDKINQQLSNIPVNKIEFQSPERFSKNKDDLLFIKTGKFIKRIFFQLSQLPIFLGNFFRKIFKKKLRPAKQWEQKIPLRNLVAFYLKDDLTLLYFTLLKKANQSNSKVILKLWKTTEQAEKFFINSLKRYEIENTEFEISGYDYSTDKNELKEYLENISKELQKEFDEIIEKSFTKLNNAYEKAGTIELSASKISNNRIEKKHIEVNHKYSILNNGWANTFFALYEDWKLNLELYLLRNIVLESYFKIQTKIKRSIDEKIIPEFNSLLNKFQRFRIDLKRTGSDQKEFKVVLLEGGISVLDQIKAYSVPRINELLLDQNISLLVDELENISKNSVEEISDKRAFVKTDLYDDEIKNSEIDYLSPKEIIHFKGLPEFIDSTKKVKNQISNELQSIQNDLNSLIEIFNFNLESAQAAFENETNEIDDVKFIAIEGVDRTSSNAEVTKEKVENLNLTISDVLKRSVDNFDRDITELTKTEKILEIKLRIAKAKAKQKAKAFKKQLIEKIKIILPSFLVFVKKVLDKSKDVFINLSGFLGFAEKPKSISTEISDFLAETQTAIELLPFVYKRLFRIEPLADERFFVPREESEKKLNTAFSNWQKERFACCAIVGEKGSGSTTFINFFLKSFKPNYKTLRVVLTDNLYEERLFFKFIGNLFGDKNINSLNDIVSFLNDSHDKKIIIIENIQHFYLRSVGGFNILKMIFEVISKTNKSTFWVMSSSLYTWEYLNKTLNISDQFGYLIRLEDLTEDQIRDVIFKRHKVSGYNIYFEPNNTLRNKKSFRKLNLNEKQEFLKKEFFHNLYKFSKSNLSLSLLYWLRATKEVSGDTITIGMLEDIDYSFLSILTLPKILTLHFLLIHDGLSIKDHTRIFSQTESMSKLTLLTMMDDGLVIRNDDKFNINPFLYRQIVDVLKSKNFIH